MKRKLKHAVVALSAAGVMLSSIAQAVPTYSLINIGTLGGTYSEASGINDSGQVVGYSTIVGNAINHAFLYSANAMTDLGALDVGTNSPANNSSASGINARGQIAGTSNIFDNSASHAVLYSRSGITDLGTLGGFYSRGMGINSSGQVVGVSFTADSVEHAFLYSGDVMTDLGTLGGTESSASDINDSGQVVGSSFIAPDQVGQQARHAFLYSGGVMIDLGTLGGTDSGASDINASSQIVGSSYIVGDAAYHAFLYSGGNMTDLGTLGGRDSFATSINGRGQIVGSSDIAGDTAKHAFLYSDGSMTDLNSLLDPQSGWIISEATGINDSGQIAANGCNTSTGDCHGFLLSISPVPEPEVYLMMLVGLGLLGMKVRRRNSSDYLHPISQRADA